MSSGPEKILVRGAKVHNLKNIDVDIPLNQIVGIAGVSGSGKSSLALGVLYAEGSRRYLESLSTYTRRRMTGAAKAKIDEIRYVPAALALHQRPAVPGIRATFGTGSELLNSLRLMYSRLASHCCPRGHYLAPTLAVAAERELTCPTCEEKFYAPGAEELAFNSQGACPQCRGTGIVRTVDESTLVPDESLTIDEGAVLPWQSLMWKLMKDIARQIGVRTDIPFKELTPRERDLVFNGPPIKHHMIYQNKTSGAAGEMDFTYFNAKYTVENALAKVKDEKGMKRVEKFLKSDVCPKCGGTRLSDNARKPLINGQSLAQTCQMTLTELVEWVRDLPAKMPPELTKMAEDICEAFSVNATRLLELGLGYLTLDRASATLSTGERQRMQLARAVRNRTTGVLYVLDEPSIGLHPANIFGLNMVMKDLVKDGNSIILVDHDTQILKEADWIVELGPGSGADGGRVIATGNQETIKTNSASIIGSYLADKINTEMRPRVVDGKLFEHGEISLATTNLHTVKPAHICLPQQRLTVVTGVSGSGKTTLILESLVPALEALIARKKFPEHVVEIKAEGIKQVKLIDATPIGVNVRSTVATYANIHDELRKAFAHTPQAKEKGLKAGDFSYNTGKLRCATCEGTGTISLDIQFLPDVEIACPDCKGARYNQDAYLIKRPGANLESYSLPELMALEVSQAIEVCDLERVRAKLEILKDLGLGYLTLGEATTKLSGGEAQRLKLASELRRKQNDAVFVFDEPTIGLHPLDVKNLLSVFDALMANGATVVVIEHDLDVIRNGDYIIDMGPGGGQAGGQVVVAGSFADLLANSESVTAKYLR
uniref:excinuclease ABC subunit UvrA n=1 Tax=Vaginimicrobium propionicum TaxID=1871034 RepID=UPI001E4EDF68|nr:excinuclease ABC subunit UvrA [Vaginimicrobium propionicum]